MFCQFRKHIKRDIKIQLYEFMSCIVGIFIFSLFIFYVYLNIVLTVRKNVVFLM